MASANGHRLAVVERGNLEDISKPPSSRSRPGSRVPSSNVSGASASSTSSRLRPQVAASLELLTPEEVMEQEFDLELEDYGGSSDDSSEDYLEADTGRTSEIFHIAEPLKEQDEQLLPEASTLTDEDDDKQLVIYGSLLGDDDPQMDSDEENIIMKEIRAEITAQVREEMKSELEIYQKKRDALTSAINSDKEKGDAAQDEEEQDPKLREAIIKMRKLDCILQKKVKREKEVKRDRIILQRKLREELESIKPEYGGREPKDVQKNTAKFLALALPPSHNAGVKVDDDHSAQTTPAPPVTPVFPTQYMDEGSVSSRASSKTAKFGQGNDAKSEASQNKTSQGGSTSRSARSDDTQSMLSGATGSTNLTGKSRGRKGKKNFLKRNKELASDAASLVAMTEEEKRRVDNLLINLEALPDVPEDGETSSLVGTAAGPGAHSSAALSSVAADEFNPFQMVPAVDGEGFLPDVDERDRLQMIDSRLKALMPPAQFESIAYTPRTPQSRQSMLFTRTAVDIEEEAPKLGEKVLQETREDRDFQKRLQEIESELNTLTSAVEHEMESPKLTSEQLQDLLDQCAITMQKATTETDALALSQKGSMEESQRAPVENTPRLDDQVLQQLLNDARSELRITSSRKDTSPAEEDAAMEPMSRDQIRELLRDSRSTSRAISQNGTASPGPADNQYYSAEQRTESKSETKKYPFMPAPSPSVHDQPRVPHPPHPPHPPVMNGYHHGSPNVRPTAGNDMHLTSYDEEEMKGVLASSGMDTDRRPFLPEIDPKGSLVAQRQNNPYAAQNGETVPSGSRRSSAALTQNSFEQGPLSSRDTDSTPTPHPPNSGRPSSGSAGKHRSFVGRSNAVD